MRRILGQGEHLLETRNFHEIYTIENSLPKIVHVVERKWASSMKGLDRLERDYYHAILEWYWLNLLITYESKKCEENKKLFEAAFRKLLENLTRLALFKYKAIGQEELLNQNQFICPCTEKLWIGLMCLSSAENNINFWDCLQKVLDNVEKERRTRRTSKLSAHDFLFHVWFMNGIVSLYQYQILHGVVSTPVITLAAEYSILDRAVQDIIQGSKSEQQMRIIILLLKPIYTQWWPMRYDFIIALWDYFRKRLNLSFQLPSEKLNKMAFIGQSPSSLLEQARIRASQEEFEKLNIEESSYKLFLSILAFVVRHYTTAGLSVKVQILFLRTILSIAPPKMKILTEQAMWNLALLGLTMLKATTYTNDYSRVSIQLLHLRIDPSTSPIDLESLVRRTTTITLVHTALLLAFCERGFDRSLHLQRFLKALEEARIKYGERLQPAYRVLSEGMCAIFLKDLRSGQLEICDAAFFGSWLRSYLKRCKEIDRNLIIRSSFSFIAVIRILDCYQSKENLESGEYTCILQPLYENVLPYIREYFSNDTATSPLVAELAAKFTLTSYEPLASFLPMFTFFAENATANAYLRFHYVKAIVKSNRSSELKQTFIIKNWLKFALLINRNQLNDLSRVVCRLQEFRALCEIPEYDLCDIDDSPIETFFKFIGLKYKELEGINDRERYEMKIKVHSLFQNFDKWIVNPNAMVLHKIFYALAIALKECGTIIYIKGNLSCLYHIAFRQYFLPTNVLMFNDLSQDMIQTMAKFWYQIMDALSMMNYEGDPTIGDHAFNMMIKWAPQFFKLKDKDEIAKPFLTFFLTQNESIITYVFSRYMCTYVQLYSFAPKPRADIGLKILLYMLDILCTKNENGKIALFIKLAGNCTMEHAFITHELSKTRVVATDIVNKMLQCAQKLSDSITMELMNCLAAFTKTYLPMYTTQYFSFMNKLAENHPTFINSMISTVRLQLMEVERARGVQEDKHMRRLLLQLEGAIGASLTKLKAKIRSGL
ncbi:protein MMS22-like isoform X2 [Wyeomyia smithii]|nr:protein MMS22-like isoform X2 [Wyeomyia smithii]